MDLFFSERALFVIPLILGFVIGGLVAAFNRLEKDSQISKTIPVLMPLVMTLIIGILGGIYYQCIYIITFVIGLLVLS